MILIPAILFNDYDHKSVSQIDQSSVEQYLIKDHALMLKVAYQYQLEKIDKDRRKKLMAL